jgi:hypothetical protein
MQRNDETPADDVSFIADSMEKYFKAFMARGFTREEAIKLTVEVLRGGYRVSSAARKAD